MSPVGAPRGRAELWHFAGPARLMFYSMQDRRPSMTDTPESDPERKTDAIDLVIVPRLSDIGGLQVRRALPNVRRRMVGPFIFLDHMGPVEFRSGAGLDVRPHPHIGLATVTYLFDGEIVHRDSLGSV